MVCFGKIIGAGLPVGAYGGKKEIMSVVSPSWASLSSRNSIRESISDVYGEKEFRNLKR